MGLLDGILARMFPAQPEPIAELRRGTRATVRGTVVPRDLMDCPLTGERCVYYQYVVEQWRQSRVVGVGGDGFWEIVEQDEAILEFYVEDSSGRAIVAPQRARVSSQRDLGRRDLDLVIHRRARRLLIEPGDIIEATGEVGVVNDLFDEGRSYRDSPDRIIVRAPEERQVKIRIVAKG